MEIQSNQYNRHETEFNRVDKTGQIHMVNSYQAAEGIEISLKVFGICY